MPPTPSRATSFTWIYNLESTTSLLLALGSVTTALAARHILPATDATAFWEQCVLPVQLPVFYFGYGYLYQRQWVVDDARSWRSSMGRELVYMLVPLVAVTVPTLLIDGWAETGPGLGPAALVRALFVEPVIPVGFFLVALALYAVMPTIKTRRQAVIMATLSVALKVALVCFQARPETAAMVSGLPYVVLNGCANAVWFCGGMALAFAEKDGRGPARIGRPGALWGAWAVLAPGLFVGTKRGAVAEPVASFLLTALGLWAASTLYARRWAPGKPQWRFFGLIDGYTKGIWLMHPMFLTVWLHLTETLGLPAPLMALGTLAVAYGLPVAVNVAMDRLGKLGFFVNPSRYLKLPAERSDTSSGDKGA